MYSLDEKKKNIIGLILLIGFIAMFCMGLANGETQVVLDKARNICLECIGIG